MNILVITASNRENRNSPRVSLFLKKFIESHYEASVNIADLQEYNFPIFQERLKFQNNPPAALLQFQQEVIQSQAVIFVIPEYNSGYPAVFKNAFDALVEEWYRKPIGICSVSSGNFGGILAGHQAQTVILKIKGVAIPTTLPITQVNKTFDEQGQLLQNEEIVQKGAKNFIEELLWFANAFSKMEN
jgi:NAD(P)H-dependent FMN reductase